MSRKGAIFAEFGLTFFVFIFIVTVTIFSLVFLALVSVIYFSQLSALSKFTSDSRFVESLSRKRPSETIEASESSPGSVLDSQMFGSHTAISLLGRLIVEPAEFVVESGDFVQQGFAEVVIIPPPMTGVRVTAILRDTKQTYETLLADPAHVCALPTVNHQETSCPIFAVSQVRVAMPFLGDSHFVVRSLRSLPIQSIRIAGERTPYSSYGHHIQTNNQGGTGGGSGSRDTSNNAPPPPECDIDIFTYNGENYTCRQVFDLNSQLNMELRQQLENHLRDVICLGGTPVFCPSENKCKCVSGVD